MKTLGPALHTFIGLFVDDGSLALQVVGIVVLAKILAILFPSIPLVIGSVLLIGCLGVLLVSAARARTQ